MTQFSTEALLKGQGIYAVAKGDVPGHEFHGNQYEEGSTRPAKAAEVTAALKKAGLPKSDVGRNSRIGFSTVSRGFEVTPLDKDYVRRGGPKGKWKVTVSPTSRQHVEWNHASTMSWARDESPEGRAAALADMADKHAQIETALTNNKFAWSGSNGKYTVTGRSKEVDAPEAGAPQADA